MNAVLIGMRGSGKTTVGKILANKLGKEFIEMDDLIIKKMGMSIPAIIEKHNWEYFRNLESAVTKEISQKNNVIISTGGGVVTRPKNIALLKKHGKLFWLKANIETLLQRVGEDTNRPFLSDASSRRNDMKQALKNRENLYQQAADGIVDTENKNPEEVTDEIIKIL